MAFLSGKWHHPKRKKRKKSENRVRKERIDRKKKRDAGLVKDYTGPKTPKGQRKHEIAKREREEEARLKREENRWRLEQAARARAEERQRRRDQEYRRWLADTPPVPVIHQTEEEKLQLERLLDLRKWMAECHAHRNYNIIAKQPIIPPYHALLDGPDPSAPRHRVLGENYRVLREGVELKELPGGDIRVSVQVAAQEQPTPQPMPSTEQEDCLELCLNEEPALPPTSRIAAAFSRRPILSRIGPKLRSVVVKKN